MSYNYLKQHLSVIKTRKGSTTVKKECSVEIIQNNQGYLCGFRS
jgi:hypothetical protein